MESYLRAYMDELTHMMELILTTQHEKIEKAASMMAERIVGGRDIYAYGPGHAGIFAEEMFYRAGGLAVVNPLFPGGTLLSTRPVTATTELERLAGYGRVVLQSSPAGEGDLLLIHSMAARNPVVVEMSLAAKERGIETVAIVNMAHATKVSSRDASGKMLYETADVVIDDCGCFGDACIQLEGMPDKIAPTSTVSCAFIANALTIETCRILMERGLEPPALISANTDGGRTYNEKIFSRFGDRIHYLK